MLCDYKCGSEAKFKLKNGKQCCENHQNKCLSIRKKNSDGVKKAHEDGRVPGWNELSENYDFNRAWSKDKTALDDTRIKANYTIDDLFTYNGRGPHKKILIKERGHVCETCRLNDWLGKPITLELEHSDGDHRNNTKENLKLLCPNCHSQTPTWRRRKTGSVSNTKHSEETMITAIKSSYSMNETLMKLDMKWGSNSTISRCMMRNNLSFLERPKKEKIIKIKKEKINYICPECLGERDKKEKTCSKECRIKKQEKDTWKDYDLTDLFEKHRSLYAMSKIIGISDNGIRKRMKKLGILPDKYKK